MNGKPESGSFRRRIYRYVLITAVIQFLLGILFAATAHSRGPISLLFLIPMANFAFLLLFQNGISYTMYPTAIIVGTFFMFLMIVAIGEIRNRIGKMIPSDPLEEALKP
jgi:K+-sensing histidine kinase KdpD